MLQVSASQQSAALAPHVTQVLLLGSHARPEATQKLAVWSVPPGQHGWFAPPQLPPPAPWAHVGVPVAGTVHVRPPVAMPHEVVAMTQVPPTQQAAAPQVLLAQHGLVAVPHALTMPLSQTMPVETS